MVLTTLRNADVSLRLKIYSHFSDTLKYLKQIMKPGALANDNTRDNSLY